MRISFALLCYNEIDSLKRLLDQLIVPRSYEYEIIAVQDGDNDFDDETNKILIHYMRYHGISPFYRRLNNDFAAQKNYMNEQCTGDYIVNLDADELLPEYLLENIHFIIQQNTTDAIWVPRINTVDGLTDEWSLRFGWRVTEQISRDIGYINEKIIDTDSEEYKMLKRMNLIIEEKFIK